MSDQLIVRLQHRLGTHQAFNLDVDLQLPDNKVSVIFGHSGSGKTTVLRCIAGLDKAKTGHISLRNEIWQDEQFFTPTHKRSIGYVFQEASLFAHLTAQKNLEYSLKRARQGQAIITFSQAVELLGIGDILKRPSTQLSGGERQRVAIARALLVNPQLLLMDEPLAALDYERKQEILPYLDQLKHELKIPIVYVSHAMDEVARLADHLVVLESGQVKQQGLLKDCMTSIVDPISLGDDISVIVEGRITDVDRPYQRAKMGFADNELWFQTKEHQVGDTVRIRILAKDVSLSLSAHKDTSINNILPGEVIDYRLISEDAYGLIRLSIGENTLISKITQRSLENLAIQAGQKLWVQIKAVALVR